MLIKSGFPSSKSYLFHYFSRIRLNSTVGLQPFIRVLMAALPKKALLRNSGMAIVLTVNSLSHLKAKAVLGGFAKGLGLMATE